MRQVTEYVAHLPTAQPPPFQFAALHFAVNLALLGIISGSLIRVASFNPIHYALCLTDGMEGGSWLAAGGQVRGHPDKMSTSKGGGGSWKSRRSKGDCVKSI